MEKQVSHGHVWWWPPSILFNTIKNSTVSNISLTGVYKDVQRATVHIVAIVSSLCAAVTVTLLKVLFAPEDINARYMRAKISVDLVLSRVVADTIILMGMWISDTILFCLYTTIQTFLGVLAVGMVQYGEYSIIPHIHRGSHPYTLR